MTGDGPRTEEPVERAGCEDVNATEFAELDAAAWAQLSPEQLVDVDMSVVPDEALPTDERCPRCHWPVFMVTTLGPHTHELTSMWLSRGDAGYLRALLATYSVRAWETPLW